MKLWVLTLALPNLLGSVGAATVRRDTAAATYSSAYDFVRCIVPCYN